ncbi:hypothetical protein ACHAXR_007270 [Thalassiosira sp. AJA248-18]
MLPRSSESSDDTSSPSLPAFYSVSARVVEEEPPIPIYQATAIDVNQQEQRTPPWWRQRRMMLMSLAMMLMLLVILILLFIIGELTLPGSVSPQSKPTSNSPTQSQTQTSAPSKANGIASPTTPPNIFVKTTLAPASTTIPSLDPTNFPTSSHRPTAVPTKNFEPSYSPSTSDPTLDPTPLPTLSPVFAPSDSPSTNEILFVKRKCEQILEVNAPAEFDPVEVGIYKLLMQSYTVEFGEMVGEPQIVTTCEVTSQNLAVGRRWLTRFLGPLQSLFNRRLQTSVKKNLLVMEFTIQYETRFGIDVEDYPREFQSYINNNLEKITADMNQRFLPVTSAREVIVYNTATPSGT